MSQWVKVSENMHVMFDGMRFHKGNDFWGKYELRKDTGSGLWLYRSTSYDGDTRWYTVDCDQARIEEAYLSYLIERDILCG